MFSTVPMSHVMHSVFLAVALLAAQMVADDHPSRSVVQSTPVFTPVGDVAAMHSFEPEFTFTA